MNKKINDKLKILLVNPFFGEFNVNTVLNKNHYVDIPLGLAYISGYVQKNRPNVGIEIYDANAEAVKKIYTTKRLDTDVLWNMVRRKIELFNPDIVGIAGLFEFLSPMINKFIDLIKDINPKIKTVLGGIYPTLSYKQLFMKNKNIDFAIIGEGEKVFDDLIGYFFGEKELSDIPGLVYKYPSSPKPKIVVNPREQSIDINSIPMPDRIKLDMELYATYSRNFGHRILPNYPFRVATVLASRGCNFNCQFCSTKQLWGNIRYRHIESVINEMKFLISKYNINSFFFPDDSMLSDKSHYIEFLKKIIKEDLNIKWLSGGLQAGLLDEETIKLSIESGLVYFPIAFESGSDETLRRLKKPLSTKLSEKCVSTIRKIAPQVYIFGAWITGLPFETKKDIINSYKFIKYLALDWSSIYTFQPYRGTPLYKECVEKGYVDENKDTITSSVPLTGNSISTENFSSEWILYNNYLANLDINFINNRNACLSKENIYQAIRDFLDIVQCYPDHVFAYYALSRCYKRLGDKKNQDKYLNQARTASKNNNYYDKFIKHFNLKL